MGNYASYYLIRIVGLEDKIKDFEYEVAHLKNLNKTLNIRFEVDKKEKDMLKEDIERLEKDNKTFKKRYETQIEENVSMFEETVALKKEIEELKNSPPPAGHTNYSWREIHGTYH